MIFLEMQNRAPFSILGLFRPRNVFLQKFWTTAFLRHKAAQNILNVIKNSYKWTVSLFYPLFNYYLLLDHEKNLRAEKMEVKIWICKLGRNILSLKFLAICPVSDPLFTVKPAPKMLADILWVWLGIPTFI